jgi:hypothetical protein
MAQLAVDSQNSVLAGTPGSDEGELVGRNLTGKIGFYGAVPVVKPTVTGSKGANAALTSLIAALVAQGLIIDTTS